MRLVIVLLIGLFACGTVAASEKVDQLAEALQLSQIMEILRKEGQAHRQELDETHLDQKGGSFLEAQVEDIYDTVWMQSQITSALTENLTSVQMDQAILFFESAVGKTVVSLENSARDAISDETIEEMARHAYENEPRDDKFFKLVDEYIQVNDLINQNVQNSLSADFFFFRGLDLEESKDDAELWAQLLAQTTERTEDATVWLYSFLLLAYQPLTEAQMRENIAFSRTDTGRALNKALFTGFDQMFDEISYQLGRAVAHSMRASDL